MRRGDICSSPLHLSWSLNRVARAILRGHPNCSEMPHSPAQSLSPILWTWHLEKALVQNLLLFLGGGVGIWSYGESLSLIEPQLKLADNFLTGRTSFSFWNPGPWLPDLSSPYFCTLVSFIFNFISIFCFFHQLQSEIHCKVIPQEAEQEIQQCCWKVPNNLGYQSK